MNRIASILVVSLAASGCASTMPTLVAPIPLAIGKVSEPSTFEKKEAAKKQETFDEPESTKAQRRRKTAFWTGVGLAGFGAIGAVAFGVGGRITQAQLANGYEDGDLTHADEDRLETQGAVMNGLTIGSAAVGLFGVALLSITYALDHARCGDLPPKRDNCPDADSKPKGTK